MPKGRQKPLVFVRTQTIETIEEAAKLIAQAVSNELTLDIHLYDPQFHHLTDVLIGVAKIGLSVEQLREEKENADAQG